MSAYATEDSVLVAPSRSDVMSARVLLVAERAAGDTRNNYQMARRMRRLRAANVAANATATRLRTIRS